MRGFSVVFLLASFAPIITVKVALAQPSADSPVPSEENFCVLCHGNADVWDTDTQHLFVTEESLSQDIHWRKGLRCHDCHGGDPSSTNLREAHAEEDGFRSIESPADIPAFCGRCHSDAEYMRKFQESPKTDLVEKYWAGVHGVSLKKGDAKAATCTSCHIKHDTRPADDPASAVHPARLVETCGNCHVDERTKLRKGVHSKAGLRDEKDRGTPMDCRKCHRDDPHAMVPVGDSRSPVYKKNQVEICGGCHEHEKDFQTYKDGVHGRGLYRSGLLVTAVCADCHGAHDIYYAADKRSTLHAANVAATCAKCHRFIKKRLDGSVHSRGGLGARTQKPAPGGKIRREPSCTDCHQGHDAVYPDQGAFRLQLVNRCGNCHVDMAHRYGMSLHGRLTQLGYQPAAECADCHGAHDILRIRDAKSRLSTQNRLGTCRKCHPFAVKNFTAFDPHADYKDQRRRYLYGTYTWIRFLLYTVFGFFALHACLWFLRSFIHTLMHGRDRILGTERVGLLRFELIHRLFYVVMLVSFLGLTLTGLPLRYSDQPWAHRLARGLGGFGSTSIWHHCFAVLAIGGCVAHLVWGIARIVKLRERKIAWTTILFGPDSPVPRLRDLRDMFGMVRWFIGLGPKPTFERWTYWEKLDYWALYLGAAVIGTSGLMLWFPNLFTTFLPGKTLNVASMVHSEVALLAASFLFIIHFFNTHFRPEKFPMDLSVLTGVVSQEHLEKARPEYVERLRREGKLETMRRMLPSKSRLRLIVAGGVFIFSVGLILLAGILLANLEK